MRSIPNCSYGTECTVKKGPLGSVPTACVSEKDGGGAARPPQERPTYHKPWDPESHNWCWLINSSVCKHKHQKPSSDLEEAHIQIGLVPCSFHFRCSLLQNPSLRSSLTYIRNPGLSAVRRPPASSVSGSRWAVLFCKGNNYVPPNTPEASEFTACTLQGQ